MAIVFTKQLPTDRLLFAFNNNVVEFYSDTATVPVNAEVTIGVSQPIILYPHPTGSFQFNFLDDIKNTINTSKFADDLDYNPTTVPNMFFDWTSKVYLNSSIEIKVNFIDDTFETSTVSPHWLLAVLQKQEYRTLGNIPSDSLFVMTPFQSLTKSQVCYWHGYPFDFTLYNGKSFNVIVTNAFYISDPIPNNRVLRGVGSDGFTTTDVAGFDADGFNKIEFKKESDNSLLHTLTLKSKANCRKGIYIKWINKYGGWNYWLFDNHFKNQNTKNLQEISNDYNNVEDTISSSISIGKTSDETVKVAAERLDELDKLLLDGLIDSPKIYLFTGVPNEANTYKDWIEIRLKTGSFPVYDHSKKLYKYIIELDLPFRNAMML